MKHNRLKIIWRKESCLESVCSFLHIKKRGTHIHPGNNVGRGTDDTLFALIDGKVKFEHIAGGRKRVSVYAAE